MIDLTDYIVEFKDNKLRVQEVVINAFTPMEAEIQFRNLYRGDFFSIEEIYEVDTPNIPTNP